MKNRLSRAIGYFIKKIYIHPCLYIIYSQIEMQASPFNGINSKILNKLAT